MHFLFDSLEEIAIRSHAQLQQQGFLAQPYLHQDFVNACRRAYDDPNQNVLDNWKLFNKSVVISDYIKESRTYQQWMNSVKFKTYTLTSEERQKWEIWLKPISLNSYNLPLLAHVYNHVDEVTRIDWRIFFDKIDVVDLINMNLHLIDMDYYLLSEMLQLEKNNKSVLRHHWNFLLKEYDPSKKNRSHLWTTPKLIHLMLKHNSLRHSYAFQKLNEVLKDLIQEMPLEQWKSVNHSQLLVHAMLDYKSYSWDVMQEIRPFSFDAIQNHKNVSIPDASLIPFVETAIQYDKLIIPSTLGAAVNEAVKFLNLGVSLFTIRPYLKEIENKFDISIVDTFNSFELVGVPLKTYAKQFFQNYKNNLTSSEINVHL